MKTVTVGYCWTNQFNERLFKAAAGFLNHNGFVGTISPKQGDGVWKMIWTVPMNTAEQEKAQAFQSQFTQVSRRFIFSENVEFSGVWVTFPIKEKFGDPQRIHFYYHEAMRDEVRPQQASLLESYRQLSVVEPETLPTVVKKGEYVSQKTMFLRPWKRS